MNKTEAWEHFYTHYAQELSRVKLRELERRFQQQGETFILGFVESLQQICGKIKAMQLRNEKDKIGYLTYSMLRTAILDRRPVYLIEAFDKNWFLDSVECHFRYQPSWAWEGFYQLETELNEKLKLYLDR
jgi:hypothetical protein